MCYIVYYFLTKDLENAVEVKNNPEIKGKVYHVADYHHNHKIHRNILQNG